MALEFPCPQCHAVVMLRFLKIGETYMCKTCGASRQVPQTAQFVEISKDTPYPTATPRSPMPPSGNYLGDAALPSADQSLPSYIIANYSAERKVALSSSEEPKLPFKSAFTTLVIWIGAYQLLAVFLEIYRMTHSELDESLHSEITNALGIVWTLLMTLYVIVDLQGRKLSPLALFNFSWSKLREYGSKVLKYFAVAASVVLFFSVIDSTTQIDMGKLSSMGIALAFIGTVIVAPICEEMVFRGYLYTALRSRFHRPVERIAVNALLFASAHVLIIAFFFGAGVPYYIFALGYFIAKLYEESNSILPCIALHMLNNGLVFLIEVLIYQGYWYSVL